MLIEVSYSFLTCEIFTKKKKKYKNLTICYKKYHMRVSNECVLNFDAIWTLAQKIITVVI